jgi:hypothetical protein
MTPLCDDVRLCRGQPKPIVLSDNFFPVFQFSRQLKKTVCSIPDWALRIRPLFFVSHDGSHCGKVAQPALEHVDIRVVLFF